MNRLEELRSYMEKEGLDGFYIAKPANVRCISAYTGDDSYLFIDKANQYFITDPRYTEQAGMECPDYEIINWRSTSIGNVIAELCKKDGVKTIGFEQDYLTFATWRSMQDTIDAELVPTLNVVERFREVKTLLIDMIFQHLIKISLVNTVPGCNDYIRFVTFTQKINILIHGIRCSSVPGIVLRCHRRCQYKKSALLTSEIPPLGRIEMLIQ